MDLVRAPVIRGQAAQVVDKDLWELRVFRRYQKLKENQVMYQDPYKKAL